MKVNVSFFPKSDVSEVELDEGARVSTMLDHFGINPDVVVVTRENTPIPIDAPLEDGWRVKIIRVVSGG